nr:unnamed protein product [Leishmania braziliensis]
MTHLTFLDLSRDSGLTDASAERVTCILVNTEVETVRLVRTSLSESGGQVIAAVAANTTTHVSCELPFTVGSTVLEDIKTSTRRNRAHRFILGNATTHYTGLSLCVWCERVYTPHRGDASLFFLFFGEGGRVILEETPPTEEYHLCKPLRASRAVVSLCVCISTYIHVHIYGGWWWFHVANLRKRKYWAFVRFLIHLLVCFSLTIFVRALLARLLQLFHREFSYPSPTSASCGCSRRCAPPPPCSSMTVTGHIILIIVSTCSVPKGTSVSDTANLHGRAVATCFVGDTCGEGRDA